MLDTKLLSVVFSMIIFTGITASSTAFAESDDQNTLDAITNIEFRSVTDFHTYLPDSQISFNVSCNQLAGEFAIGFNTIIEKSDGSPGDVNDVRNLVFLQRGSSNLGAIIDAANTGPDRLELTTVVTCAKLLPDSLLTVSPSSTSTGKTIICHNDKIILYLPSQAVGTHEKHDDTIGDGALDDCSIDAISPSNPASTISNVLFSYPTSTPGPTEKTAVCHNDKIILYLPSQAVGAHEKHDDTIGDGALDDCSDNTSTLQEKSKQQAKKLQLDADKAKADRLAKQEADKAQREADRLIEQQAKKLQLEADKAPKESILEAKNNQNNSKKDNKESKLPTPGPK